MEHSRIGKYTRSFGLAFAITSVLSALWVILKESSEEGVLAWMKAATGHHWVTHGIIDIILFVVLGWALARAHRGQGVEVSANGLVSAVAGAVVVSWILIAAFNLLH